MHNVELKKLLPVRAAPSETAAPAPGVSAPPLVSVLWGRRWTFGLTALGCVAAAAAYLLVAAPVYRSTATIYVQQNAPRAYSDSNGAALSDTYLQTQADFIQSTPVLVRALEAVHYAKMNTFRSAPGNPVTWLRRGGRLDVEVVKRSDVINVSIESPYPEEAAVLADAVVSAYVVEQAQRARETGQEMVKALQREKEQLQAKREAALLSMLEAQREGGVPTFRDGKGNLVLGRLDSLATSLHAAELATIEAKAQQEAILNVMDGGEQMRSYVEGLQFKGRDFGDREYDELRSQLAELTSRMAASLRGLKPNHPRVRDLQASIDSLKQRVAAKEESIAAAQLAEATSRLQSAQQKETELRAAVEAQRARALDMSPAGVKYARLESDVLDMQRRAELLDNRIAELNVNSVDSRPFNVSVLQPAMVADKPVKPNKALTLAAALLAGCVLGMGFATLREWKDARLRTPEEVTALLGMPLVGIVPQINRRLSPADRGQVLRIDSRSRVAEAYRSIRTSLHLGNARSAKTILVASPSAGDGKSTTAGNLAIAFAQAGERTLLMDCDLREPVQHLIFETDPVAGVSTVMPGETKLRDAVVPTRVANLFLLPCGPVPRNPAEMIASDRFKHLLKTLASGFDRVVIDSPPLEEVTDGRILAAAADVTVLVLRMNQSMRRSGVLAVTGLTEVGADVLGVVANDVPSATASRYDGGHWQYASGRGRDSRAELRDESTVVVGALPGGGEPLRMADDGGAFSAESVSIRELDWPAERP